MIQIQGGCHCGQFRYFAEADASLVRICHCRDCQILSGSAFRVNLPVAESLFTVIKGSLKTYVKIAESGNKRLQCFCGDCGSQIYATSEPSDTPRLINIRVGTVDQYEELVPRTQGWCQSRLKWLDRLNEMAVNHKQ